MEEKPILDWPAAYDDAHDDKYDAPYLVPMKIAKEENLKGYGTIVTDFDKTEVELTPWPVSGWRKLFPGTGVGAGVISGDFLHEWSSDVCRATNRAAGWDILTGRLPKGQRLENRTHVLVREASYHPDGGQVFFPQDGDAFVALLALPGDDVKPENFVAFYFDGSFGVQIHADIWHQPLFPVKDRATFKNKQGAVHGCVTLDFPTEYNRFLLVPLKP